jgi:nitroreductase
MDIIEAIQTRKSIRDFTSQPVPQEVVEQILEIATRAPSAMNIQPWEFAVLTGEVLENVKKTNIDLFRSGAPMQPEHATVAWPQDSVYRQRQVELGMELFRLMDIPRDDGMKRAEWMERGFYFFNAPVALILLVDRVLGEPGPILDLGLVAQTVCLTALHFGIHTCIEHQGVFYPEVLHAHARIPATKRIITSIAMGYPNWDFPANQIETKRDPLEKITTWHGFD